MAEFTVEIDTEDMIDHLTNDWFFNQNDYAGLIDFIMSIDHEVADLGFTVALRNKLNEAIEKEETA